MPREVVFDTETTGLSETADRIVEIGAVELQDYLPTGRTFHAYVNPQMEVPQRAFEIHGLNYEFLKRHPTFKRVWPKFQEFVGDAPLIAHNAPYDFKMFKGELARLGLPPLANRMIDTLPMAKRAKPGGQHNLDVMCKFYGIDNSKRVLHGALLDSEILAEVYLHLNGGRQFGIELAPVDEVVEAVAGQYGLRSFRPRLTPAEREAHAGFIGSIGAKAIWNQYLPKPEGADLH
jgi:DNA polymerase-3 subunit epsilon